MILGPLATLSTPAICSAADVLADIRARRMRNMWVYPDDGSAIHQLADLGFNTATCTTGLLAGATPVKGAPDAPLLEGVEAPEWKLRRLSAQAQACAERGMLYMPYINQLSQNETIHLRGKSYRKVVNHLGREGDISPCPLERRDWFEFQLPQMLALANLMVDAGCAGGIMLECETYDASDIYPGYHSQRQEFCYCDHCFDLFTEKLPRESRPGSVLERAARYPWLASQGLLWEYELHMNAELTGLLQEFAAEVRKVKPDCLFGLYPYAIHWYSDAYIGGTGAPELPTVAYSAAEYYPGHCTRCQWTWSSNYASAHHIEHLRRGGLPHIYIGGFWVGWNYWPKRLALEMPRMAGKGDGYWLIAWGAELLDYSADAVNCPGGAPLPEDERAQVVAEGEVGWGLRAVKAEYRPLLRRANDAVAARASGQTVAAPAQAQAVWENLSFAGPDSEPRMWTVASPPSEAEGWSFQGAAPSADPTAGAFVMDLTTPADPPLTLTMDFPFTQPAGTGYVFGARVRYEGPPVGARVNLASSAPECEGPENKGIFCYQNQVIWPSDEYQTVWTPISLRRENTGPPLDRPVEYPEQDRPVWVRISVRPNPGRVWIAWLALAPAATHELASEPIHLPHGRNWGSVRWELDRSEDCIFSVDVVEADTGRPLLVALEEETSLDALLDVCDVRTVALRARCIVPAASQVTLERCEVTFT